MNAFGKFGLIFGLFSPFFVWAGTSSSEPLADYKQLGVSVHSDQRPDNYLNYTFVKGDSLKNVLRRLRLFPIWGNSGSYQHFLNLNPDWSKKKRADSPVVAGKKVRLPIDKAPFPKKHDKDQWLVKFGEIYFINRKSEDNTDLYTRILNLGNLAKTTHGEPKKVQPMKPSTQNDLPLRRPANLKTKDLEDYRLGDPVVKIPVRPGSALAQRLLAMGLEVPELKAGQPYAYVEIPLHQYQEGLKGREPQAVGQLKMQNLSQQRYRLNAEVVTASRIYSITDSNGQAGEVGIDPGLGAEIGFAYRQNRWLDVDARVNYQMESFRPDDAISIVQETDSRLDVNINNYFSFWSLKFGLGVGVLSTPSFLSATATSLTVKHLSNPYARLSVRDHFYFSKNWVGAWSLAYDQFFGVKEGPYQLQSGYRVSGGIRSLIPLNASMGFSSHLDLQYQDDQPVAYNQSQMGFQFLMGLQWNFGGAPPLSGDR